MGHVVLMVASKADSTAIAQILKAQHASKACKNKEAGKMIII